MTSFFQNNISFLIYYLYFCDKIKTNRKWNSLQKLCKKISSFMWGWPMIIMLLGTHLYLTIRLRFPQLHILKALRLSVSKDKDAGRAMSASSASTGHFTGSYHRDPETLSE